MKSAFSKLAILPALFFIAITTSNAQVTQPPLFVNELVSNGWNQLSGFTFDAHKRMYVWEKEGRVWTVDSNGVKAAVPLLNISEEVGGWRDHGLLGFTLDPNYMTNGYIYLLYTVDRHHLMKFGTPQYNPATNEYFKATIIRLTKYQVDVANGNFNSIVPNSRNVLIGKTKKDGIPLLHESHSGGQVLFGDDGTLLISTGDGASYNLVDTGTNGDTYWAEALADTIIEPKENVGAFRSQLVDCLAGKILRVDPDSGKGLRSNPFYDPMNPRAPKSLVWCVGLRNPYRMTLRKGSGSIDSTAGDPGTLYIGDVGWNTFEDIHIADQPGLNFGWPIYEGLTTLSGYLNAPVPNKDAPNPLFGTGGCTQQYFTFQQLLKQATLATNVQFTNPCNAAQLIPASIPQFFHSRPSIDYLHGNQSRTGIFNGVNAATIDLDNPASPVPGPRFGGNASTGGIWYTSDRFPATYQNTYFHADYVAGWIKNFTYDANDKVVSVRNFASGLGPVVFLEVHPSSGTLMYVKYPAEIRRIRYTGVINNPPAAVVICPQQYGPASQTFNFNGSFSADPENLGLTYLWNFGDGNTSTQINPSHVYSNAPSSPNRYTVKLTVTDNIGQTNTDSVYVWTNNTPPQINITSFNDGDLYSVSAPTVLPLQATVTDSEHAEPSLKYSWETILHHNVHTHLEAPDTNRITTAYITPDDCNEPFYYEIILRVTDPLGLSSEVSRNIYPACSLPVPVISADDSSVCRGSYVQFSSLSTMTSSQTWYFQGGTPSVSTDKNPVVKYTAKGNYDVKLVVTNPAGSDSVIVPAMVTVFGTPVVNITPGPQAFYCRQDSVKLKVSVTGNPAGLTYQWSKYNNAIPGATSNEYWAKTDANYKITAVTPNGCVAKSKPVTVSKTPVFNLVASGPLTFCNGDSVILSTTFDSNYTYQWYNKSSLIQGATQSTYTAYLPGKYKVSVSDSRGPCEKVTTPLTVTVSCREGNFENTNAARLLTQPVDEYAVIEYYSEKASDIRMEIYDMSGRFAAEFADYTNDSGFSQVEIPVSSLAKGLYMVRFTVNNSTSLLKMMVQ